MWITRSRPSRAFRSGVQTFMPIDVPKALKPGYDDFMGLMPIAELNADLEVTLPWWAGVEEDMRLQVAWKAFVPGAPGEPGTPDLVGTEHIVLGTEAGDSNTIFRLSVPQALLTEGKYLLNVRTMSFPGGAIDFTQSFSLEIDLTAPGGGTLPLLTFDPAVEASQTVGDDDIVNGELPAVIAHYEGIKPGDVITPMLNGDPLTADAITLPDPLDPINDFIKIGFNQAAIEANNGASIGFSYRVKDRAGNEDPLGASPRFLTTDLNSKPENLLPPLVPLADNGLIDDADARTPVEVQVPKFDKARVRDEIEIHWGNQRSVRVPLTAEDLENDPFIGVQMTLAMLSAALLPDTSGSVNVSYYVYRNGNNVAISPTKTVLVDLTLVGGPNPGPDPEHPNLHPAKVISDSGAENDIPADDFDKNATAVIPWRAVDGTEHMQADDRIVFIWGDQTATPLNRTVTAADVAAKIDLELTVPPTTIGNQGGGTIDVYYTISRETDYPPHRNTSLAPEQPVTVTNKVDLPGGGTLPGPTFPVLNSFNAIGPDQLINSPEGKYNPVRVALTATNIDAGDSIELFFVGYDALNGGNLVPGAEYTPAPYEILLADMTATYYEFRVPARYHYAVCSRGAVEAHVIIRNTAGATTSLKTRVFCDVKLPSEDSCPIP